MIALPELDSVPRRLNAALINPLAARCSLALAGDGPIYPPRREVQGLEIDTLQAQLQRWLTGAVAEFEIFDPRIHIALGQAPDSGEDRTPESDLYSVWLGPQDEDLVGSVWCLERRWNELEKAAPGLAPAALIALEHAGKHSLPLYTPSVAFYFACYAWWWGEEDEKETLSQYREERDEPMAAAPDDMPTRAWLDKVLPPAVTMPRTRLGRQALERLARRGGELGAVARNVLELQQLSVTAHRRKSEFSFESSDDEGFLAASFAATLRWNARDPMFRAYDDHTNEAANNAGVEEAYGWFVMDSAKELPALLKEIERYFQLARAVEKLIPLVSTRQNR
jgi:PRTRC genetic system protein F